MQIGPSKRICYRYKNKIKLKTYSLHYPVTSDNVSYKKLIEIQISKFSKFKIQSLIPKYKYVILNQKPACNRSGKRTFLSPRVLERLCSSARSKNCSSGCCTYVKLLSSHLLCDLSSFIMNAGFNLFIEILFLLPLMRTV